MAKKKNVILSDEIDFQAMIIPDADDIRRTVSKGGGLTVVFAKQSIRLTFSKKLLEILGYPEEIQIAFLKKKIYIGLEDEENDKYILESADRAKTVVLGWGKADANNLNVKWRANEVMTLLEPYKNKLHVIGDGRGQGYSDMFPKVRNRWQLVKLFEEEALVEQVAEKVEIQEETKPKKRTNQKTKK